MISAKAKPLLLILLGAVLLLAASAVIVFSGLAPPFHRPALAPSDFGPAKFDYQLVDYADLPGWMQDDPTPAFDAFLRSCEALMQRDDDAPANPHENLGLTGVGVSLAGSVRDWREPCDRARDLSLRTHADPAARRSDVRSYFEFYFQPVQAMSRREPLPDAPVRQNRPLIEEYGVFTGYFEPVYAASRARTPARPSPVYPRPDDLVDIDLGAFRDDMKGERLAGRLEGRRLVPYPDRGAIYAGALDGSVEPIGWLSETDLFFLQIQGSGQLAFGDGETVRVNYAGQNGHPYTAIGAVMADRGLMALEDISMQSIRAWLDGAEPFAARELREQNASYVFFRTLGAPDPVLGPPGAQGVALTPERSLAVDRRYHPLSAPVWIVLDPVEGAGAAPIRRLMIAQDIGGAIRGPVRGDVYWGAGAAAGEIAGWMNARGRMYILAPKPVAARLAEALRSS